MSSKYGPDDPRRPVAVETHPTQCPNGHTWRGRGLCYMGWCTTGRADWDYRPPHRYWFCKTCGAEVHHDGVTDLCVVMRLCDANGVTTANPALDNPEFYHRPSRPNRS